MHKVWAALAAAGVAVCATDCGAPARTELYPPVEPLRSGYLRVSDLHELYWEEVGNPRGVPVIVLHDGPGDGASPAMRRYFDPLRFHVLLFDQRGAQRSRPRGEWRENTTQDLIEDINRLRDHVGIAGKAILFGGSWGSTLALAYAEQYPERVSGLVLHGVFLCSSEEIDFRYHGGASMFFPDAWERFKLVVPRPDEADYPRQLFEAITGDDPREREVAIEGWAFYETRMSSVYLTDEATQRLLSEHAERLMPLALLHNYYLMNGCFLREMQLLEGAERIARIPTFVVQGRYDTLSPPLHAWNLARRLERIELELTDAAGHSMDDPPNVRALLRGVEWVARNADRAEIPVPEAPPEQ